MALLVLCLALGWIIYRTNIESISIHKSYVEYFLVGVYVIHLVSYGSSSLIEEEHQLWYFFTVSILFILYYHVNNNPWIFVMLVLDRITRYWNVSGIKDMYQIETPTSERSLFETSSACFSLLLLTFYSWKKTNSSLFSKTILFVLNISLWVYTLDFKIFLAMDVSKHVHILIVYLISAVFAIGLLYAKSTRTLALSTFSHLWFLNEHTCNYPLISITIIQVILLEQVLQEPKQDKRVFRKTKPVLSHLSRQLICQAFAMTYHFKYGRSISASSIDFSVAYQGLSFGYYHPLLVGFSLFVKLFAGRLVFDIFPLLESESIHSSSEKSTQRRIFTLSLYQLARIARFLMSGVILLLMQSHLFIWSVFSPKFLSDATLDTLYSVVAYVLLSLVR